MKPSLLALTRQSFLIAFFLISTACGVFTAYKVGEPIDSEVVKQRVTENLKKYLQLADQEAKRVSIVRMGKRMPNSVFHFLELKDNEIVAWNDYHFIPPTHALIDDFDLKFVKLSAGEFLLKRWVLV